MRALRCERWGTVDELAVGEVDDPQPGPGQALVRVRAAGVNFSDVLLCAGRYQVKVPPPFTPGAELAGEVVAVGDGVEGLAVGDRVASTGIVGAIAELAVVDAASATVLPAGVDLEAAAVSQITYLTAHPALHALGQVQPGQWVVVTGAAGGVGGAVVDLARLAGARVLAVVSSDEKDAAARAAGAEVVVRSVDGVKQAIKDATGGGADLVVDQVGGAQAEACLRALRPGGRFVVVGFASGEIPSVSLGIVLVKAVSVHGLDIRVLMARQPDLARSITAEIVDHLAAGRITPLVSARYDLDHAVDALRHVAERRAVGKVVVAP